MKFKTFRACWLILFAIFLFGCSHSRNKQRIKECTDGFATYYFNYQFDKAEPFCTTDSKKWLQYAASQVHQADVDLLRSLDEGASHHIEEISFQKDDSVATVRLVVNNFVRMDSIGTAGHLTKEAEVELKIVQAGETWRVKLSDFPRTKLKH